jgi:hypothetical protein
VGGERRRSCEWRWVAASERGEMARSGGGLRRRNKGLMMAMAAGITYARWVKGNEEDWRRV